MPLKDVNLKSLVPKLKGYSGADIEAIVREAGMLALRENLNAKEVPEEYFRKALEKVRPSLSTTETSKYEKALNMIKSSSVPPSYMG